MRKTLRWLSLSLVFAAMVTQFNNCGSYESDSSFTMSASSMSCVDSDCVQQTVDNLSVKANLSGYTEYSVPAGLTEFDMGGDCNEGGFPYNTVRWELYYNNIKVRDSSMPGTGGSGLASNSVCVNGRFRLYVNLNTVPGDPVNRTGLSTGTVRAPYDLWIEIYGQEAAGGPAQRNLIKGRTRISLIAI